MKTKATMLSTENARMLFDHILDGFKSSYAGIQQLKEKEMIDEGAYIELLEKNSERLITRIKEFKVGQRLLSISFAALFFWTAVTEQDLELRRPSRMRLRRRNETEQTTDL